MKNKPSKKKTKNLSVDEIVKIAEALERIERKIDNAIRIANPVLNVKGYPVANLDWTTLGNKENV